MDLTKNFHRGGSMGIISDSVYLQPRNRQYKIPFQGRGCPRIRIPGASIGGRGGLGRQS